jgi:hypothetical protein
VLVKDDKLSVGEDVTSENGINRSLVSVQSSSSNVKWDKSLKDETWRLVVANPP